MMAIWDWLRRKPPAVVDTTTPAIQLINHYAAGENILSLPAVFGATELISSSIASMPLAIEAWDGRRWKEIDNPGWASRANPELSTWEWVKGMISDKLIYGSGVSYIRRVNGVVHSLWPLDPRAVKRERRDGRLHYLIGDDERPYDLTEIVDLRWRLGNDQLNPLAPAKVLRDAFSAMVASRDLAIRNFSGAPTMALTISAAADPKSMDRAAQDIASRMREVYSNQSKASAAGSAADNVVVMPAGTELKNISTSANDMQFVELEEHFTTEVARIYGIPRVFLSLAQGGVANAEQVAHHFLRSSLGAHVRGFESVVSQSLWPSGSRRVRLDEWELLKPDTRMFMDALGIAVQRGLMTPNEARGRAGFDPASDEGADALWVQSQMVPLDRAAQEPDNGGDDDGETETPDDDDETGEPESGGETENGN